MPKRKADRPFGQIERLPSGRYRARYTAPDGARYSAPMTYIAKAEAMAWLDAQEKAIKDGRWDQTTAQAGAKHRGETVGDYAAAWIKTRVNRHGEPLRPRTRVEYERLITGPIAPLADARIESLTPVKIRAWYTDMIEAGTRTQAARAYGLLKAVMATAVSDGRIPSNPCQVRGAANASTGRKVEPPTPAELQRIVDAITPNYRAAVLIAAWAGTRYGELTELRRKDILITKDGRDVSSIVVNVARAVTHVTGEGYVVGKTKSEAGVRAIALPPHIFGDVIEHLRRFAGDFPDSLLFPAHDGVSHLAESTFVRHWYPARAAAGRDDLPFHALRHYGATRFALTGATLKEIQTRLGHSTVSAAMRYQHAAGRDEELARRMSDLA